jgi:putative ABC transport system permease protein
MPALFGGLSAISILIACLGIFGLVSFTVERRRREIAIRRVLGASVSSVFGNLTRGMVILVLIANVLAVALAYPLLSMHVEEYPYQADIGILTYLFGGMAAIVLVLIASTYHVIAAARANPTNALKYE